MIKTFAIIQNDKVINLISWNGKDEYNTQNILVEIPEGVSVSIGDTYLNGEFIPAQSE